MAKAIDFNPLKKILIFMGLLICIKELMAGFAILLDRIVGLKILFDFFKIVDTLNGFNEEKIFNAPPLGSWFLFFIILIRILCIMCIVAEINI